MEEDDELRQHVAAAVAADPPRPLRRWPSGMLAWLFELEEVFRPCIFVSLWMCAIVLFYAYGHLKDNSSNIFAVSLMQAQLSMIEALTGSLEERLSLIEALKLQNERILEKQQELEEKLEMLKRVITAVSDEREAVLCKKQELQEKVAMLQHVISSLGLPSERQLHLLRIRVNEMELEKSLKRWQKRAMEVQDNIWSQFICRNLGIIEAWFMPNLYNKYCSQRPYV